ncbi:MAG: oligosaccharide flippase family protein [Bermanella sp.]
MIKLINSNIFFRQVLTLAGGTAAAQLINLVILPLLTRLYTPNDFGAFALMTATSAILGVFIGMRFENSIIAVKTDGEALQGTYAIMSLAAVTSASLVVIWAIINTVIDLSDKYMLIGYLSISFTFISCCVQAVYFLCNRASLYRIMTQGRIYAAISLAVITLVWGGYLKNFWGLLLGSFVSMLINFIYLWLKSRRARHSIQLLQSNKWQYLKDNIRFPKYLVASSLIDRSSSQGYLILFTRLYGETVTGSLSLYNKVAGLPSVLIGSAIGDVFKRNASERLRAGEYNECKRLVLRTAGILSVIAFIPFILLLFYAPLIFEFVFGSQWRQAGEFARLLAPVFILGFVVSPISSLIYLEDNQKYDLYLQSALLILLVAGIGLAYVYGDVYSAVMAYAFSYCLKYCFEFSICWKIASGES